MPPKHNFEYGHLYHVFNRGNNRRRIFFEDENYWYFLRLYKKYIPQIAKTFAFALLPDHFHFLLSIKSQEELADKWSTPRSLSQPFSNLFNAYAKAINKRYKFVSSLFEDRFERLPVKDDAGFTRLIYYIHRNPQKHRVISDFRKYKYSSYNFIISGTSDFLEISEIENWFGDLDNFKKCHDEEV